LLEAMATGTPVVTTNAGGIPDIVQDSSNGFIVECGNDQLLAGRIVQLLHEKQVRSRFSTMGKTTARMYMPEIVAQQHLNIYNESVLLSGRTSFV